MNFVSLCECTQKLKVLFSCVVIKLRVLFTSWFACTHCAENYLLAIFLSFFEYKQKFQALFLCVVVKARVFFRGCCHGFVLVVRKTTMSRICGRFVSTRKKIKISLYVWVWS